MDKRPFLMAPRQCRSQWGPVTPQPPAHQQTQAPQLLFTFSIQVDKAKKSFPYSDFDVYFK